MVSVMLDRFSFDFRYALNDRQKTMFDPSRTFVEIYSVPTPAGREERGWTCLESRRVKRSIEIDATAEESAAWIRARTVALDALSTAEQQVVHDLGLRIERGFYPGLRRAHGWSASRRRAASQQAFDELEARLHDITEHYRPVREQIDARVHEAEARAQELQEIRWRILREREQRDAHFTNLAARTRWSYHVTESDRTVHVSRDDDSPLTTPDLIHDLQRPTNHLTGYTVHWAPAARTEIEHATGTDFTTWWTAVAPSHWPDPRKIPPRPPTRPTPSIGGHSSYGGHDSFSSCGGGF